MSMDLIKVAENGQLEFDFESLEAMTSAEFVLALKKEIPKGHTIIKSKISEGHDGLFLYFMFISAFDGEKHDQFAYSCTYHKYSSYPFFTIDSMTVFEIGVLNEFING